MRWLDADRLCEEVARLVLEAIPEVEELSDMVEVSDAVPVVEVVLDDMSLLEVVLLVVVDAVGVLTLVVALVCVTTVGELDDLEPQPTRARAQPAARAGAARN